MVKRYKLMDETAYGQPWRDMGEAEPGEEDMGDLYVLASDYDALLAERDLLLAIVESWIKYDNCEDDVALRRYQLDDAVDKWKAVQK